MVKYGVYVLVAVMTTFILHEFSHWVAGRALGYDMIMTLNKVYPRSLSFREHSHFTLISAVGPLITLMQAIVFYFLLSTTSDREFYPFLFAAFYVELLSGVMNFSRPNDLGRVSETFQLGLFTIPTIFVLIHFYMVYSISKHKGYTSKFNGFTFLLVLLFSSVWILANQRFNIVILG